MSPEQVKTPKTADLRTDLWAVGVMFFEMLTGTVAFSSPGIDPANVFGLISAVLTLDPPPLASFDPSFARFDPFLKRALAKDPNQRFQSAREMAAALAALDPNASSLASSLAPTAVKVHGAPRVATFGTVDATYQPPRAAVNPPNAGADPYGATAFHPSLATPKVPSNPPASVAGPHPQAPQNTMQSALPAAAPLTSGMTVPTGASMAAIPVAQPHEMTNKHIGGSGLLALWVILLAIVAAIVTVVVLAVMHVI
jgi:serine/threonine-protein kinase